MEVMVGRWKHPVLSDINHARVSILHSTERQEIGSWIRSYKDHYNWNR